MSLPNELLTTSTFTGDSELLLGSQSGKIFYVKFTSSSFRVKRCFNINKNFFVTCIATNPTEDLFAVGFSDGFIKIFDPEKGQCFEFQSINVIVFSS